jgi:lysophospholipase L1-like esterase
VTRRAIDGSLTADVEAQLVALPADASHLVVSSGGNDALQHADILDTRAHASAAVLDTLAAIRTQFERTYQRMLTAVRRCQLPTAVCTIYEPQFPDLQIQRRAVAALSLFNDCILREAIRVGVPVLDLRLICHAAEHYANPIEPSTAGGARIAHAIASVIATHDFQRGRTEVYS